MVETAGIWDCHVKTSVGRVGGGVGGAQRDAQSMRQGTWNEEEQGLDSGAGEEYQGLDSDADEEEQGCAGDMER